MSSDSTKTTARKSSEADSLGNQSRWHVARYMFSIGDWRAGLWAIFIWRKRA